MKRPGLLVGIIVVFGCGGGGSGVSNSSPISGVLDVADFSIPAGMSRTVSSDLTIRATGTINIAGSLRVPAGVNVLLVADREVNLSGQIVADASSRPGGRGTGPYFTNIVSENIRSTGSHSVGAGGNIGFAGRTNNAALSITGPITLPAGRNSRNLSEAGQNGGAILIGSNALLLHLEAKGTTAFPPRNATISGNLTAGAGGRGFDDVNGIQAGGSVSARASRGGDGGNIEVSAVNVVIGANVTFTPGAGGEGGWIGRTRTGGTFLRPIDGASPGENGDSAFADLGAGGSAGRVIIPGTTTGSATIVPAKGGDTGSAYIEAADGGLIANGGSVSIIVPANSKDSNDAFGSGSATVEILNGFGGVGNEGAPGGNASKVSIARMANGSLKALVINDGLRGGNGFDGCKTAPQKLGTNGGDGGILEDPGVTATRIGRAMNGGDGGNSIGLITSGGTKGTDGMDGLPGRGCGEAALVLVLTHGVTLKQGLVLAAGTEVSMSRVRGGTVGNVEAGCDSKHVHGPITIDGYGPFEDMDHGGCGHGKVR